MELSKGSLAKIRCSRQVVRAVFPESALETDRVDDDDHVERGEIALVLTTPTTSDKEVPCLVSERTVWVPVDSLEPLSSSTIEWKRAPSPEEATPQPKQAIRSYLTNMTRHLSEDLQQFWPATPKNEMAEANLVLHLGAVLRARRFRVFAEVPLVGERTAHIDLLAFNDELAIAVEAKRLFNTDKADEMASDFERVMDGQLPTYEGSQRIPNTARLVGLIVASTWQTSIRDWWLAEDQRIAPGVGAGWGRLSDALDAADGDVGVLQIQDDPDGSRTQWLLYAWKERTMPFTPTPPPPPPMSR